MTAHGVGRVVVVSVLDNMRVGGTELNAVRTAALLDRSRFDLRVACFNNEGPLAARYRSLGIPVLVFPIRSLYGPGAIGAGIRFARYLRSERVQIVHAHDMYSNVFVVPWARLARTPVIIASRRWWHSLPNRKLRVGNQLSFRAAHAVLANSQAVAQSVRDAEHIDAGRIWVVPNFADDSAFEPLPVGQRAAIRAGWGISPGAFVVGCVARLVPVKDHSTLLRGFALLHARVATSHLVLIGDGECRAALESLVKTLGIDHATTFVGELRGGENHHRAFDVSVLCSLSEGFPNTLVEAMAAAVPIVASRVGGIIDAVIDRENGLLVPPQHAEALGDALGALADDPDGRRAMGLAGQVRANDLYRAAAATGRLQAMYESLLAARSA